MHGLSRLNLILFLCEGREAADKLEDENIKRKIGNYKYKEGPDFIALEVKYHHECKREYLNKVQNTKSNNTLEQSVYNIHKSTFEDIVSYIKETVVLENKPQFASDILDRHKQIYQVKGGCKEDVDSYSIQYLTFKLKSALDNKPSKSPAFGGFFPDLLSVSASRSHFLFMCSFPHFLEHAAVSL